jgi:transposase-like protein
MLDDRMSAALTVTDTTGVRHVVDLTLSDARNMFEDLARLLGANQAQVDAWWQRLADGRDGRPRAKVTTRAGGP